MQTGRRYSHCLKNRTYTQIRVSPKIVDIRLSCEIILAPGLVKIQSFDSETEVIFPEHKPGW